MKKNQIKRVKWNLSLVCLDVVCVLFFVRSLCLYLFSRFAPTKTSALFDADDTVDGVCVRCNSECRRFVSNCDCVNGCLAQVHWHTHTYEYLNRFAKRSNTYPASIHAATISFKWQKNDKWTETKEYTHTLHSTAWHSQPIRSSCFDFVIFVLSIFEVIKSAMLQRKMPIDRDWNITKPSFNQNDNISNVVPMFTMDVQSICIS